MVRTIVQVEVVLSVLLRKARLQSVKPKVSTQGHVIGI